MASGSTTVTPAAPSPSPPLAAVISNSINNGTMVVDFSKLTNGTLNFSGDFTNNGTVYGISTNPAVTHANIVSQGSIHNNIGGLITTVLPTGGLAGYSNAIAGLSLTLSALQSITNAGTISSASNLTLQAGTSIINALPAGVTGPAPVMQAVNNLNIQAPNITNSGHIVSMLGNINFGSISPADLVINNTGGTIQAAAGAINIRDSSVTSAFNTSLIGGDWLSKQLNIYSGTGVINANVNQLTGLVNVWGSDLSVSASTNQLQMGAMHIGGDPVIDNGAGTVYLNGDSSPSGALNTSVLSVNASKDIIANASSISTAGGNVTLTAGGIIDLSATNSINTTSSNGGLSGFVDMHAGGAIKVGTSSSTSAGGTITSGNWVRMISDNGSIAAGDIKTPATGVFLKAGGNIATGNITVTGVNAGSVDIQSNMLGTGSTPFNVGIVKDANGTTVYTVNGVNGEILANSTGQVYASPNFVHLYDGGTGGINIVDGSNINVSAQYNQAGAIALEAPNGSVQLAGHLSADATGGVSAGDIFISSANLIANNASITADVSGNGYAGYVVISTNAINYTASSGSNGLLVSASSTANNTFGAGLVQFLSAGNQTIKTTFDPVAGHQTFYENYNNVWTGTQTIQGDGSTITWRSSGGGGVVSDYSNTVKFNNAPLHIDLSGSGDLDFESNNISLSGSSVIDNSAPASSSFQGGVVYIGTNNLVIPGSLTINANGGNSAGGGYVQLNGDFNQAPYDMNVSGGGQLSINANGGSNGGFVDLGVTRHHAGISVASDTHVAINANGNGNGFLGNVEVDGTSTGGNLSIGNGAGQISISATGPAGAAAGDGGRVTLQAIGNITIDPSALNINPSGSNGSGGSLLAIAGYSGVTGSCCSISNYVVSGNHTLTISGSSLSANGVGSGNGGSITLVAPQIISNALLSANAGSNGNGGTVAVYTASDLRLSSPAGSAAGTAVISANGGTISGNGGNIQLIASGNISVGSGAMVDAKAQFIDNGASGSSSQTQGGNGGSIIVTAGSQQISSTSATPAAVIAGTLDADGAGNGNGGTISVNSAGDISIGGTVVADGGNGGSGGTINLTAGKSSSGLLHLDGTITANGATNAGSGGIINATYNSSDALIITGTVETDGFIKSGEYNINNRTGGMFVVLDGGTLSAASPSGVNASGNWGPAQGQPVLGAYKLYVVEGSDKKTLATLNGVQNINATEVDVKILIPNITYNVGIITATKGNIFIQNSLPGSSINLDTNSKLVANPDVTSTQGLSGSTIYSVSAGNISLQTARLVNNGEIFATNPRASTVISAMLAAPSPVDSISLPSGDGYALNTDVQQQGNFTGSLNITNNGSIHLSVNELVSIPTGGGLFSGAAGMLLIVGTSSIQFSGNGTYSANRMLVFVPSPRVVASGSQPTESIEFAGSPTFSISSIIGQPTIMPAFDAPNIIIDKGQTVTLNFVGQAPVYGAMIHAENMLLLDGANLALTHGFAGPSEVIAYSDSSLSINVLQLQGSPPGGTAGFQQQGPSLTLASGDITADNLLINTSGGDFTAGLHGVSGMIGTGVLAALTPVRLFADGSSAAPQLSLAVKGNLSISTIDTARLNSLNASSINVVSSSGSVVIADGASATSPTTIHAGAGSIFIESLNTSPVVNLGSNVRIEAASDSITIAAGPVPALSQHLSPVRGFLDVVEGPGVVLFDGHPLHINGTGNTVTSGSLTINLIGGDSLSFGSNVSIGQLPKLEIAFSNLDFVHDDQTFAQAVATGTVRGTFSIANGVPTGTIYLSSANISPTISSLDVPSGVSVFLTGSQTLNVVIDSNSSAKQAVVNGQLNFTGTNSTVSVNSDQSGASLFVNSMGAITSTGALSITSSGAISLAGTVSAQSLNIRTTGASADVIISNSATASQTLQIAVSGNSKIAGTGVVSAPSVSLITGAGDIGSLSNALNTVASSLNITASNASAFIAQTGNLALNASIAQGTLSVVAAGNITAQHIDPTNVILSTTTASSGNINLAGDIFAGNSIVLRAGGSGSILFGGGKLVAPSVKLSSDAGSIGTAQSSVDSVAANLTANTSGLGNVYVINSGNVGLGTSSAGATFQLIDSGSITTTGSVSAAVVNLQTNSGGNGGMVLGADVRGQASILLSTDGSGSISQSAGIITAPLVAIQSSSGNLGTNTGSLQLATANLTANTAATGNVFLYNTGNCNLNSSAAGNAFQLSNAGNISTSGVVAASNVTLQTATGSNGSIAIGGNVKGTSSVSLVADGTGNISQTAGQIAAPSVTLQSGSGNIGTSTNSLQLSAGNLAGITAGQGNIFVSNATGLTVSALTAGGSITLASGGSTSIAGNVTARNGSVALVEQTGRLSIVSGVEILANEGNVLLQNNDTASGSASIGSGTTIQAFSMLTTTLGRVTVSIGPAPAFPVAGHRPANVITNATFNGHIYYGSNSISAACCGNVLTASDSSIIFNTGSLSASAISLEGGVNIKALAAPVFTSLNVQQNAKAFITAIGLGTLQGTLYLVDGKPVGLVTLRAVNIAPAVSSLEIPRTVSIDMLNFQSSNPILLKENSSIFGSLDFVSTNVPSNPVITMACDARLTVARTGILSTDGNLTINTSALHNNGLISSSGTNARISISSEKNLHVWGHGSFDFQNVGSLYLQATRNLELGNLSLSGTGNQSGSNIILTAGKNIEARSLTSNGAGSGNGGDITVTAGKNIEIGRIAALGGIHGNGGNITATAGKNIEIGRITASGGIIGNGGNITLVAGRNVSASVLTSVGGLNSGNGGLITISTTKGDIAARDINTSAAAGNAGNIRMHSAHNVAIEKIYATSLAGAGGNVLIQAAHNVNAGKIDVSSQLGTDGSVTIEAGGKARYRPIGFVQTAASAPHGLQTASLDSADIWQAEPTLIGIASDGTIGIDYGSVLVMGKTKCAIEVPGCTITVAKGAILAIDCDENGITVRCLHDEHRNSVLLQTSNARILLHSGEQASCSVDKTHIMCEITNARVGLRRLRLEESAKVCTSIAEFSMPSLAQQSRLLQLVLSRHDRREQQVAQKIVLTTACLMTLTSSHGPYREP